MHKFCWNSHTVQQKLDLLITLQTTCEKVVAREQLKTYFCIHTYNGLFSHKTISGVRTPLNLIDTQIWMKLFVGRSQNEGKDAATWESSYCLASVGCVKNSPYFSTEWYMKSWKKLLRDTQNNRKYSQTLFIESFQSVKLLSHLRVFIISKRGTINRQLAYSKWLLKTNEWRIIETSKCLFELLWNGFFNFWTFVQTNA